MGAPIGNVNASKNGTRIDRRRLTIGELPRELLSARREARAYRRDLESATLAAIGEISVMGAHVIDTACAATIHASVCRWLLRFRLDVMTPADILACSRELVKAKQARDAAVRQLGLDAPPPAPWVMIDATPPAVQDDAPDAPPLAGDALPIEPPATPVATS
ncbi:MAG: hypothetical protein HYX68_23340 [Planctomycetes bacterium]|nr:hypothetical protein [Planctomycetota bacterium]